MVFKRFKEKEKFIKFVSELETHKITIIFKIKVFKLCKEYSKLLKSSIGLGFFKSYYKDIKAICEKKFFNHFWAFLYFKTKPVSEIVFLSFKTKPATQVLITDIQAKIWKSFYGFILFEYVFIFVCTNFWVACL